MTATLKLTHKTIGAEVRRGKYDVVLDGKPAGSLELNDPIEIPVEPGHHTLQVRNGRNSSRTETFRRGRGRNRRLPMRGKADLADLPPVLRRSQPGTLAQARVGAASERGRHRTAGDAGSNRGSSSHRVWCRNMPRRKRNRSGLTSTDLLLASVSTM
jgi:hypothetical protein